jgi:hypothetical protein
MQAFLAILDDKINIWSVRMKYILKLEISLGLFLPVNIKLNKYLNVYDGGA